MEGQHNAALFRIDPEGGADAAGFTGCSLPEADSANTVSLVLTLLPKLRWRAEHILLIAQQATRPSDQPHGLQRGGTVV